MIDIFYDPKKQKWSNRLRIALNAIIGRQIRFGLNYETLAKLAEAYNKVAASIAKAQKDQQPKKRK